MRIGRLKTRWTGPEPKLWERIPWTPFLPYAWSVRTWRFGISWLVKGWECPRRMSRQERRQTERKLLSGKSVVFSNTPPRGKR